MATKSKLAPSEFAPDAFHYCTALQRRGKVCGQRLEWNGQCPHHFAHVDATPRPRRWPAASVLVLGLLILVLYATGTFTLFGPFHGDDSAPVGSAIGQGLPLKLVAGHEYGIYSTTGCYLVSRHPTQPPLLITVTGPTSITKRMVPYDRMVHYPVLDRGRVTFQCALFTPTQSGNYVISYLYQEALLPAQAFSIFPSSGLWPFQVYKIIRDLGLVMTGLGVMMTTQYMLRRNKYVNAKRYETAPPPIPTTVV